MEKTEFCGLQRQAGCATGIGQRFAKQGPIVNFFSAQGATKFCQMNAYLMRATGLQPAFNHRIVIQTFERPYVRHRSTAGGGVVGTATSSVSTVADETSVNRLCSDVSVHNRQITTVNGVIA